MGWLSSAVQQSRPWPRPELEPLVWAALDQPEQVFFHQAGESYALVPEPQVSEGRVGHGSHGSQLSRGSLPRRVPGSSRRALGGLLWLNTRECMRLAQEGMSCPSLEVSVKGLVVLSGMRQRGDV